MKLGKCEAKVTIFLVQHELLFPTESYYSQQINFSIPGTAKLNSARVFYLGLCPSGLFILKKKNKFSSEKKILFKVKLESDPNQITSPL